MPEGLQVKAILLSIMLSVIKYSDSFRGLNLSFLV